MADEVGTAFRRDGVVILRSAFSDDAAAFLRDQIWRHIERETTVRLNQRSSWKFDGNFGLRAVESRDIWHALHANPGVVRALDELFGPDQWAQPGPPQILLTFPSSAPWRLPSGWHIDFGWDLPTQPVYAVKMFALLDTVEPGGGGPLLLHGSHQLMERLCAIHGQPVDPWDKAAATFKSGSHMARLIAGGGSRELLDEPFEVDGVPLRAVEVTGDPGDVVLTHMQVFHSPSANVSWRPRQMVGNAIRRVPIADAVPPAGPSLPDPRSG